MPGRRGNYNKVLHHVPTIFVYLGHKLLLFFPEVRYFTQIKTTTWPDERLDTKIYFPGQRTELLGCKTKHILSLATPLCTL